jgi:hypothetical protein
MQTEMWVVMHENLSSVRRTRLVFDHLAASLEKIVRPRARRSGKPNS